MITQCVANVVETDRVGQVVELINRSGLPVVSIDVPSGIHSDTGQILGASVRATHTVTMGFPKVGMLFYPGKQCGGELVIADLGFPDEVLEVNSLGIYLLDRDEAVRRLPARPPDAYKYRMGTVLTIAGSRAYTGAALLTAEAALRSGCGMVYVGVPESIRPIIQAGLREAIVVALPETAQGTIGRGAAEVLVPYIEKADTLAVGPGLTTNAETLEFVRDLAGVSDTPMVLDADAVTAYAGNLERLGSAKAPAVITPHSGELQRALEKEIPTDPVERIQFTRVIASRLGLTLVHKGAPTLVASADGEVWINHSGNSALATAGTGDVLAGLIAGLSAQGAPGLDAACVGCFLHGRSADYAAEQLGPRVMIAGDLVGFLSDAMLELDPESG